MDLFRGAQAGKLLIIRHCASHNSYFKQWNSFVNHLSVELISSIKIIIIIIIIIIIRIQNGGRIAENATHINENSSTKLEFSYNLLIPLE